MSRAHFNGKEENCLFPGKILLSYSYIIPDIFSGIADANLIAQGLASFGKNHADGGTPETGNPLNFNLEKKLNFGIELNFKLGGTNKLAVGYAGLFDLGKSPDQGEFNFYVSCKLNWLRF